MEPGPSWFWGEVRLSVPAPGQPHVGLGKEGPLEGPSEPGTLSAATWSCGTGQAESAGCCFPEIWK